MLEETPNSWILPWEEKVGACNQRSGSLEGCPGTGFCLPDLRVLTRPSMHSMRRDYWEQERAGWVAGHCYRAPVVNRQRPTQLSGFSPGLQEREEWSVLFLQLMFFLPSSFCT